MGTVIAFVELYLCTERKSEMNSTGAELGSVTCGLGCAAED